MAVYRLFTCFFVIYAIILDYGDFANNLLCVLRMFYKNDGNNHVGDLETSIVRDSIRVPYPVDKVVEVNRLRWYQEALMWVGVGALIILMLSGLSRGRGSVFVVL